MKRIMYLSIIVMCLTVTLFAGIHIGLGSATAQTSTILASAVSRGEILQTDIYMENGDWYWHDPGNGALTFKGNIFEGTLVEKTSWGSLKRSFSEEGK